MPTTSHTRPAQGAQRRALLRAEIASHRLLMAATWLRLLSEKANFDPAQPRVPAGNPDGGQWTGTGGEGDGSIRPFTRLASAEKPKNRPVNLIEEEQRGGHTISEHVGKSGASLLAAVRGDQTDFGLISVIRVRDGSFPSLEAATKLVNSTLSQNSATVALVAAGVLPRAFVTATFGSKTGIEAYRPSPDASPYLRDTYGVGVTIEHNASSGNGYRVVTAYPRND